jgi:hypothetical protein
MQLSVSTPSPSTKTVGAHAATVSLAAGPLSAGSGSIGKAEATFAQLLPTVTPVPPKAPKGSGTPTTAQEEAAAAVMAGWNLHPTPPPAPTVALPGAAPAVAASVPAKTATALTDGQAAALAAKPAALPTPAAHTPAGPTAFETAVAGIQAKAAQQPGAEAAAAPATPPPAASPTVTAAAVTAASEANGAKIAVPPPKDSSSGAAISKAVAKKIQNADSNAVTSSSPALGTAVAKVPAVMPATATTERHASVPSVPEVASVGSSSSGPSLTPSSAPTETASTAQSAVQAAMTAAELVSSSAPGKAVNLQFSMGNADLNLRVELVNGQVHATFATDSAQLRSDLANEWQTSSSTAAHGSLNLAQPTFTSATSGNSLGSGDSAPQQHSRDTSAEAALPYGSVSSSVSPAAADDEVTPRVPVSLASALHLQTFA